MYRIQLFHCLQPATEGGGETLLVDGFAVSEEYRKMYPEGFEFLSQTSIESEYLHTLSPPYAHYKNTDTVFKLHSDNLTVKQIRLNPYDRATHEKMDLSTQLKFYELYPKLIEMAQSEDFVVKLNLTPGNVLLLYNWRVLHGRTAFKGQRTLSGCYVGHQDFLSQCRVHKLIE